MEILHAFGVEWKLLAVQALNFGIAFFVLFRYAYKPITAILDKRATEIAEGVAAADAAKNEAAAITASKEGILLSAREEGGKIAEDLRKEGLLTQHKIVHDAQTMSESILAEAHAKAAEERAHLMREAEKEIAKTAILAAEKILRGQAAHS
jgi:F-type H+-transporting ATPase subunit b